MENQTVSMRTLKAPKLRIRFHDFKLAYGNLQKRLESLGRNIQFLYEEISDPSTGHFAAQPIEDRRCDISELSKQIAQSNLEANRVLLANKKLFTKAKASALITPDSLNTISKNIRSTALIAKKCLNSLRDLLRIAQSEQNRNLGAVLPKRPEAHPASNKSTPATGLEQTQAGLNPTSLINLFKMVVLHGNWYVIQHQQQLKARVQTFRGKSDDRLLRLQDRLESLQPEGALHRQKMTEYIRQELNGQQFILDAQVPKEVTRAAIPLDKKDTLISHKTLISKILGSKFTDANLDLWVSRDGSISLENRKNGSKLSLVKADGGRMRVTRTKGGVKELLGTAWNDDALKLCERFAKGTDLGIQNKNTTANRAYYIPPADFLKDNPAQPHKDNPSTARKTGSLVRF